MTDRMQKVRDAAALARQSGTLERLSPVEKARRNPSSLRMAITVKCFDCVCGSADPNPRDRIRSCPCQACPLYPVRPYQRKEST